MPKLFSRSRVSSAVSAALGIAALGARAPFVAFGAVALAVGISSTAMAQTSATGTIFGQVDVAKGATISIISREAGTRRTLSPDTSGRFSATSLPVGVYDVQLLVDGKVTQTTQNVEVRIGQGSEVSFAAAVQRVEVLGLRQKIDVSTMGSTTVFTSTDLARVPVASNVGAVIQLAPNTTRGDSRYGGGNAPSFGGASASENAYYINGFPVTTLLTQVGFSQLPFNSIAQAQVLTGGYGAEFGRSTGGVVNIVTKRGTNEWLGGVAYSIEPNSLRSKEKDQVYADNGVALDGKLRFYNGLNKDSTTTTSAYLGGPIVKDKLFMFVALEDTKRERDYIRTANTSATYDASAVAQSTRFQERDVKTPRYLVKLDWNITNDHHLEYTKISDQVKDTRAYFGFDYKTLQRTSVQNGGQTYLNWGPAPTTASQQGAEVDILKYTGNLTQDLTVTALIGKTRTPHEQTPLGFNPGLAQVVSTAADQIPAFAPYGSGNAVTGTLLVPGAFDKNAGQRFDVEYKLNSQHSLRAGVDRNKITSKAGSATAGQFVWTYGKTNPAVPVSKESVATNTVAGNPYAQQGYWVQQVEISTASTPTVEQSAWYIEDRFQVTKNILLSLGLRNEAFNNKNGDGQSYVNLSKQLAPRLGATWDVMGDSSLKVFGNLGRYHVPLPTNVAVRGAGSSLFATRNYVYTGVDANGIPTGLTPISPRFSNNNELGQAKDPLQVAAQDMKGNFQDEFALGFEKAVSRDLNVGAKFTHRALKTAIDDHCDDRPFHAWAARNGIDSSSFGYNCALFNPGLANTFNLDLNGDGRLEKIALSAADLGFPAVERKYIAVDVFAEHPFDGKWWGKVTYTWSRNTGNMEGQLLSDIGQGDVATTQVYDFPEFSVNSQGRLPNDRRHQVKLFGYYQALPEWGVGGNLLMASGRPKNCIGNAPVSSNATNDFFLNGAITNYSGYGSAYFFCNGVASPRGSAGNLPADMRLDLNVSYKPDFFKGFGVKLDIFNVFNRQVAQTIEERYNAAGGSSSVRTTYGAVEQYSAPRSMKITLAYDHKF